MTMSLLRLLRRKCFALRRGRGRLDRRAAERFETGVGVSRTPGQKALKCRWNRYRTRPTPWHGLVRGPGGGEVYGNAAGEKPAGTLSKRFLNWRDHALFATSCARATMAGSSIVSTLPSRISHWPSTITDCTSRA